MPSPRRLSIAPTLFLLFLLLHRLHQHAAFAGNIPVRYKINSRQTECVYEELGEGAVVTLSVFVVKALNNGNPKVIVSFDGPVGGNEDILPRNPNPKPKPPPAAQGSNNFAKVTVGRTIRQSLLSDWPQISGLHSPNGVIQRSLKVDWTHAGESEDAEMARAGIHAKNHDDFRKHAQQQNQNEEGKDPKIAMPPPEQVVAQRHVEPYEETFQITARGWYRLCAKSHQMPLLVEMDLRTGERMKGVDHDTGHVYAYGMREHLDEQMRMFENGGDGGAEGEGQDDGNKALHVDDLKEAKTKLQYMHELTTEIMKSQMDKRRRVEAHAADVSRGAAALAWTSKLETLLYVAITGVQVYTVHKWLLGNLLGK